MVARRYERYFCDTILLLLSASELVAPEHTHTRGEKSRFAICNLPPTRNGLSIKNPDCWDKIYYPNRSLRYCWYTGEGITKYSCPPLGTTVFSWWRDDETKIKIIIITVFDFWIFESLCPRQIILRSTERSLGFASTIIPVIKSLQRPIKFSTTLRGKRIPFLLRLWTVKETPKLLIKLGGHDLY